MELNNDSWSFIVHAAQADVSNNHPSAGHPIPGDPHHLHDVTDFICPDSQYSARGGGMDLQAIQEIQAHREERNRKRQAELEKLMKMIQ